MAVLRHSGYSLFNRGERLQFRTVRLFALILETKPEVVSFHFGLPEPEVVRLIEPIAAAG
jgi:hypothetical protein